MRLGTRSLSTFFALAAVVVAIAGYVVGVQARVGGSSKHPIAPGQTRAALAGSVLIEAPPGWRTAPVAPGLPGVALGRTLAFAPGGDASQAGLLTGLGPAAEASPLPPAFRAALDSLPAAQVVALPQAEVLRYPGLHPRGFGGRTLTLYAVPSPGAQPTLLACYAPANDADFLRACEQVVSTLRPIGSSTSAELTPDPAYGARVSAVVAALEQRRDALRARMSTASGASAEPLARQLASSFATAASALTALEPPLAAGQAQAALGRSLLAAGRAYTALAAAAAAGDSEGYEAARAKVAAAEADSSAALQAFALIGYRR